MIEKAIKYIVGLKNPEISEINGTIWSDKPLTRVCHNPHAEPITMNTLHSLVDYIKIGYDLRPHMFVHIVSPTKVMLYSTLDDDREREYLVNVVPQVPSFSFDRFMDHEEFCINVQTKFVPGDDRALLLKFAGTVEAGSVSQYGDDGTTQKATIKTGVASKADAVIPNPVTLRAYRTFPEVEQPRTQYIFRMKQSAAGSVVCALFESDGNAWELDAKHAIRLYLTEALEGFRNITIIS